MAAWITLALPFSATAGAATTPEVVDQGDGWQRLLVQPDPSAEGLELAPWPQSIKQ
jgi:hypothetical protein